MTSTTTPTPTAAPQVDDPLPAFAARAVPLVAAGWLLGGWIGLAAAALGVASTFRRPASLVAAAAPVMLVVAALATVIEVPVDSDALRSSFADDRPTAATAGLIAALFALIAVVTMAVRDRRAVEPADAAPAATAPPRSERVEIVQGLRTLAPLLGIGLATLLALVLLAPAPPAATDAVADNVRLGLGWGTTVDDVVVVDGTEPPLAVVVAAVAPGGAALWTGLAGATAALLAATLVGRRAGRREALLAAALVGLGLVVLRADLAACLAAALVAAALLAGDPDGRTTGSAALAGAAFGGAVLAVPVLGLALPVVVAALTFDPRTRDVRVAHGAAGLAAAVVVVAPWQRWLVERFSTWAPAAEIVLPLSSALAVALVVAVALALPRLARTA